MTHWETIGLVIGYIIGMVLGTIVGHSTSPGLTSWNATPCDIDSETKIRRITWHHTLTVNLRRARLVEFFACWLQQYIGIDLDSFLEWRPRDAARTLASTAFALLGWYSAHVNGAGGMVERQRSNDCSLVGWIF